MGSPSLRAILDFGPVYLAIVLIEIKVEVMSGITDSAAAIAERLLIGAIYSL